MTERNLLFLQGPISPFFSNIAQEMQELGHGVFRINLCYGDQLIWQHPNATCYRGTLKEWPDFIENYFIKNKITDVLVLGEQRAYHKIAFNIARKLGAQTVATDFGYIRPDWITFEKNGMSRDSLFPRDPQEIRDLAKRTVPRAKKQAYQDSFFNQAILDMKYHLSTMLMGWRYPHYDSHQIYHPTSVYMGIAWRMFLRKFRGPMADRLRKKLIDSQTPYFVFPLQIENDFQLREYSPFDSLTEAITDVISDFSKHAEKHHHLVIKVHPLDPARRNWWRVCRSVAKKYEVGQRVHFIDGGSLADLVRHSEGVVTINSTVGIWALNELKPLKVMGDAIYDVPGLTYQGLLENFWHSPDAPDEDFCAQYMRAIAGCIQIRGVYYNEPGLSSAVKEASYRLHHDLVNQPLPEKWAGEP